MQVEEITEEWYGMYEYTRSKFTLKTVYFVNSKGIGRSEMNNYPSSQYQYTPQTLVLWDHIYNILRGKKTKTGIPFFSKQVYKTKTYTDIASWSGDRWGPWAFFVDQIHVVIISLNIQVFVNEYT